VRFDNGYGLSSLAWGVEVGVKKEILQIPFGPARYSGRQGDFSMKGSALEIAVSMDKIRKLLEDLGPTKQYRVRGWTAVTGGVNEGGPLQDLRETEASYFTF
jgi:hypothetical protein